MNEFNVNKAELHYHGSGGSFWDFLGRLKGKDNKKALNKESLRILFIDDNKFPVVTNLKRAGYQVEWIKDVKKTDDPNVFDSHIIFVDYKGVGKNLSDKEGIGVCKMLMEKYGSLKYIVLFTGENIPNELIREVQSSSNINISKNRDTSEYIDVIEKGIIFLNT